MNNKLFVIGNGFDLAHDLPTSFDPDFKNIAGINGTQLFWELYQIHEENIWSAFENSLGRPNYNSLEAIFDGYEPDYFSDRESDRNSIIFQVDMYGDLKDALYKFADNAENTLDNIQRKTYFDTILDTDGYYLSFNYTHTLEKIYHIPGGSVLHIHGEVGKNNLELGYPQGNYTPDKYVFDPRQKGRGPFIEIEIEKYIDSIEDYYVRTAYLELVNKCKSFYKENRIDLLNSFLDNHHCKIGEIIVYGHSCEIDFDYFKFLNSRYPNASWTFFVFIKKDGEDRDKQYRMAKKLIEACYINNASIVKV